MNIKNLFKNLWNTIYNTDGYVYLGQVNSSNSLDINIPNSARGLVHVSNGNAAARTALFSVICTTTGTVVVYPIYNGGDVISYTVGTNKMTINSTSTNNSYVGYIGRYSKEVEKGIN